MNSGRVHLLLSFILLTSSGRLLAGPWGRGGPWGDKRAEVAVYDSERIVDDKPRKFQEQITIIKEDLNLDTSSKSDNSKKEKPIRVFRMNNIQNFDSQNYPTGFLTTVYMKEDSLKQIVKCVTSVQDWTGASFKTLQVSTDGTRGALWWNSKSDGELENAVPLEIGKTDYFEDQLAFALREIPFKDGFETKIRVWGTFLDHRGTIPSVQVVNLRVESQDTVPCRAGSFPCWKVILKGDSGTDTFWFEKAEPHLLVKSESHDGHKRLLYARARWSYWDKRLPKPNILK